MQADAPDPLTPRSLQRITHVKLSHLTLLALIVGIGLPCIALEQDRAPAPAAKAQPAHGQDAHATSHKPSNILFTAPLQDAPGKQLIVVGLELQPKGKEASVPHRHPGSVYVYVTRGTARLGLEGQPVQEVHTGQSFFEPPGSLHTITESASETEPASAIAVMIVPNGAPLVTVEPHK